jgi:GT2 family glycosyltransferase
MMSDPTLLTVILNYKTPEMTLKSLAAALHEMDSISGAITVVDNDSQDGSYETLQQAIIDQGLDHNDRVRVIQSGHNGGFGAGNNVGIRARLPNGDAPDYIYILNSDAFPSGGAIKRLLAELQTNLSAGFAGSYIHGEDGGPHITAFRFPTIQSELETAIRFGPISKMLKNHIVPLPLPDKTCAVDWLAGASLMMRQIVLDEIGLFDEQFFLYFEETDLCKRAKNAGWPTIYVRESEVAHIGSVSTGMKTWVRMPSYWFDSRLYYFTKNHGRIYATVATIAHLAGGVLNRLRNIIQRKQRADPPKFLRDMAVHSLRSAAKSFFHNPRQPKNTVTRIISKDTK